MQHRQFFWRSSSLALHLIILALCLSLSRRYSPISKPIEFNRLLFVAITIFSKHFTSTTVTKFLHYEIVPKFLGTRRQWPHQTMTCVISCQKTAGCTNAPSDFPSRKYDILLAPPDGLTPDPLPSPTKRVRTDGGR